MGGCGGWVGWRGHRRPVDGTPSGWNWDTPAGPRDGVSSLDALPSTEPGVSRFGSRRACDDCRDNGVSRAPDALGPEPPPLEQAGRVRDVLRGGRVGEVLAERDAPTNGIAPTWAHGEADFDRVPSGETDAGAEPLGTRYLSSGGEVDVTPVETNGRERSALRIG